MTSGAGTGGALHLPVLPGEVVDALRPRPGGNYVDGTFGAGGHAAALLEAADCRVFAIDRDPAAIERARALAPRHGGRLEPIDGRFGEMDALVRARHDGPVDGVLLDLGVSSPQIDDPARGFSFLRDGPLDMRMGRDGPSAADVVAGESEAGLADIVYRYGEERHARRVARAIVRARAEAPIRRTGRLAEIVRRAVPAARRPGAIDPATRTFQALRIHVNDELGELDRGLAAAERLLSPGGRLAAIAFHSLEDRRVKAFLRARQGRGEGRSRHAPPAPEPRREPSFRAVARKPARPGRAEVAANPRARSARLRVAERTAAPAWSAPPERAEDGR